MKRYLPIFVILFISCTYVASEDLDAVGESTNVITNTSFKYIDKSEAVVIENFTDKKTIIIFWADY